MKSSRMLTPAVLVAVVLGVDPRLARGEGA
jgi:hypothetical protein